MAYLIQEPTILRCPGAARKDTPYFSPALPDLEIIEGGEHGTICIAESNRILFESGQAVRAIILDDPLAWIFQGERAHEFEKEQIAFGMVRRKTL